jgi:predicted transcriptional regulator
VSSIKLTEEKVFILYKDILASVKPEMSIKEIARSTNKGDGKPYNYDSVRKLLLDMEELKLMRRIIDEPKCTRYKLTKKGESLLSAESVDKIRR